ncbi:MAG: glutathione S-transferase N-terminal domain-containing protein [Xanthomonadales bacterium]|uniref:glutathione S-transferase family protein n=1 Tax=Dokdonella sp. TaxID=2291710 RepID=UPI002C652416|nr:glutathione S-transferase N-terminal domain-containing protein [Xanthomonadales bacterium]HQV72283.1 glutathione binding-like protein [Dokdonella sp.]MBK7211373.1 glutathione S-transferase N-terminal domain-containing protein [Xanthomonadales bacterium]MBL0221451.1 glutathione S-transferase N-terminal domain-containing protein [Xanthomonadales bacterium]HQX64834.1 glutathione binding-like protein [Dokdonella sp.]
MKLYCLPGACSLADHIVLEWIGKPYEISVVPRDQLKTGYLKINPNGAVPALEVDGWVLTQNSAILNYLADENPESGLGGDGSAKSRAEINRWLAFVNADVHPAFKPLFGTTAYLEDPAMIEKSKDAARKSLRGLFEKANAQLEGRDWLAGTRSIADPYLYVVLRWAQALNIDLSGFDNLAAFSKRMESDPAVGKVLKAEGLA